MGLFFYNKIGSIISIGDLPTTNIIEPDLKDQLLTVTKEGIVVNPPELGNLPDQGEVTYASWAL